MLNATAPFFVDEDEDEEGSERGEPDSRRGDDL